MKSRISWTHHLDKGVTTMKRLISTAIAGAMALSLMAAVPANAAPRHGGNDGAALAVGLGMIGLIAVLASQNNDRDDHGYVGVDYRDHDRGYHRGWHGRDGWRGDRGWRH
jgi:hypothetical protein